MGGLFRPKKKEKEFICTKVDKTDEIRIDLQAKKRQVNEYA